jgi:uncharacterized membrane protein YfcA
VPADRFCMYEAIMILLIITAFLTAALTLMTGFGLATILTPVLLIFYDVKTAIIIAAIVHLLNNLLKIAMYARHLDIALIKRFGLLTLVGAFAGAFLQGKANAAAVKVILGTALIFLGLKEVVPSLDKVRFPRRIDFLGGFFSGLLGGLVGNQGAIRSAYLLNYDISKETFIVTAAVIASVVDVTRIPLYLVNNRATISDNALLILLTTAAAFVGTVAGSRLLAGFSPKGFKLYVAVGIVIIGILLTFKIL